MGEIFAVVLIGLAFTALITAIFFALQEAAREREQSIETLRRNFEDD